MKTTVAAPLPLEIQSPLNTGYSLPARVNLTELSEIATARAGEAAPVAVLKAALRERIVCHIFHILPQTLPDFITDTTSR